MAGPLGTGSRVTASSSALLSNHGSGNFDETVGKKGKTGSCANLVLPLPLISERVFPLSGEPSASWQGLFSACVMCVSLHVTARAFVLHVLFSLDKIDLYFSKQVMSRKAEYIILVAFCELILMEIKLGPAERM